MDPTSPGRFRFSHLFGDLRQWQMHRSLVGRAVGHDSTLVCFSSGNLKKCEIWFIDSMRGDLSVS